MPKNIDAAVKEHALRMLADVNDGTRERVSSDEQPEIHKVDAENRRLREDNQILRRASSFLAGELDPRAGDHGVHRRRERPSSRGRVVLPGSK